MNIKSRISNLMGRPLCPLSLSVVLLGKALPVGILREDGSLKVIKRSMFEPRKVKV